MGARRSRPRRRAANTGSFVWTASGADTAQARVRVTSRARFRRAASAPPSNRHPDADGDGAAAGASWAIGTARTISWSSNLPAGIRRASRSAGTAARPGRRSRPRRPPPAAWPGRHRAGDQRGDGPRLGERLARAGASGAFAIGNPALSLTSPAAGASWTIGTPQTITWSSNLLPTRRSRCELSRNGGSTYTTLAADAPNTGTTPGRRPARPPRSRSCGCRPTVSRDRPERTFSPGRRRASL